MKKVADLEGAELDYWVAKSEGVEPRLITETTCWVEPIANGQIVAKLTEYGPSTNWQQGGAIIERERISISMPYFDRVEWKASRFSKDLEAECHAYGPTPLVAVCRCFVKSKFGDTVDGAIGQHDA